MRFLLEGMLQHDINKRFTIEQCLCSEWILTYHLQLHYQLQQYLENYVLPYQQHDDNNNNNNNNILQQHQQILQEQLQLQILLSQKENGITTATNVSS